MTHSKRKKVCPKYILIPFNGWTGWCINEGGLISPEGKKYDPSSIALLEWKSAFYDRGLRSTKQLAELMDKPEVYDG